MSSTILFHNTQEINWKLWGVACITAAATAALSFYGIQEKGRHFLQQMNEQGVWAENLGHYKQARRDFDLALLKARTSNDKKALINALINCSRVDNEFDEEKLSISLASEAVELSETVYGKNHPKTAEARLALAECLSDNDKALALYTEALKIFKEQNAESYNKQIAKTLVGMSLCYDAMGLENQAISACKASMRVFGSTLSVTDDSQQYADFAQALIEYATIAQLPADDRSKILSRALGIQSDALGREHPALAMTLSIMAAQETDAKKKEELLRQAVHIDENAFGKDSTRVARDLLDLCEVLKASGQKKAAQAIQERAAKICKDKSGALDELSTEFLDSYSKLLHELKFDGEAKPIDALLKARSDAPIKIAFQQNTAAAEMDDDSESNPEYWQRTEALPIEGLLKFETADYDHIQVWYDKGVLKLDAFREGAIVWQKEFAQCPTGIVNASVEKDKLTINWRDGDGPVWHNDEYRIGNQQINLIAHHRSDAYAQQISQQLDGVLAGDSEALMNGAVESVPASYVNKNFIAGAIRKGEHLALDLYGQGDPASAADRLGMVFDLTAKAIDVQRSQVEPASSRPEGWLAAWKYMQLPVNDYIGPLNDYGFFLQQSGCLKESVSVLRLVISVAPERAVAYLNLADSMWDLEMKSDAQEFYGHYLTLMKSADGAVRIPPRVFQRSATASKDSGAEAHSVNLNNFSKAKVGSSGKSTVLRLSLPGV